MRTEWDFQISHNCPTIYCLFSDGQETMSARSEVTIGTERA
jgi:hypothetical protein